MQKKNSMSNQKRFDELDILKGIGILFMVFDHIGWGNMVHTYIQSFHMPLFFIVSGFLWTNKYSLFERIKKKMKSLIIPYICFSIFYLLICVLFKKISIDMLKAVLFFPTDMNNMPLAPALWFLPCMFITDIVYSMLNKAVKNRILLTIVVLLLGIIGSIYSSYIDFMLPFTLEPMLTALVFWHIGHIIRQRDNEKLTNNRLVITIIILVVSVIFSFANKCIDMRSARYYIVPLYFINGILGTLVYWNLSNQLAKLKENRWTRCFYNLIKHIGTNSMIFVVVNQPLILILNKIFTFFKINENIALKVMEKGISFIIIIFLGVIINKCLNKTKLKFIIGK